MKLSIIILSYNTKALLKQTIDSIDLQDDWEIIVVDNNSSDGSPEMIEVEYPKVKLIQNEKNIGFGAANNQAMKVAQGEYYLILNSDTEIMDNAIQKLIDYLETHPIVGAVTPKVILPDGSIDLACHRGMPTPWRAFTYFSKLERAFPESKLFGGYHLTNLDFNKVHQVEATAATAMLVRKKTVDEVGMFDERFFLYAEDLDWCKRMTEANWQIYYLPEAVVVHHKSQSGKKKKSNKKEKSAATHHFYDTMKQFYEKHYQDTYPWYVRKLVYWGIDIKKWMS